LPQIIASLASFAIFPAIGQSLPGMLVIAGIAFLLGAVAVSVIHPKLSENSVN